MIRASEAEMDAALRHFRYTRLPAYLKKKLENMPNDKGYIVNEVVFLGNAPPQNRPHQRLVLFEPFGNESVIHEYTTDQYRTILWNHRTNSKKELKRIPVQGRGRGRGRCDEYSDRHNERGHGRGRGRGRGHI